MKIVADYYNQTSDGVIGGVQSKNLLFRSIDPSFQVLSYADACKGLGKPAVTIDGLRFREWEANYILQKYIDTFNKTIPNELDLIVYNSICGGYMKHDVRTISMINDNYIEMPDRLYAMSYLDVSGFDMYRRMYLKLQLDSCRNADLVVAESKTDADMYKNLYGIESTVIENGVDDKFWTALDRKGIKEKYNIPLDKKIGIFVGAFSPIKGFHILQQLIKKHPEIHWIPVLKHKLDQNVRSTNVSIATEVDHNVLRELYSISDFCIQSSIWESGHSINSLEALSCNLPLVVSAVGGYADKVGVNDFGIAVKDWTPDAFDTAVKDVLNGSFKPREALFSRGWDLESYKKRWEAIINPKTQ